MDSTVRDRLAALTAYFEGRNDVAFAFLYGSHARGTAGGLSDVDIAVYFTPPRGRLDYQSEETYPPEHEIWADLEKILGRDVELLVLNRASPNIAASALRGTPLAVRDWGLYMDFFLHATGEADEFREDMLADFLEQQQ